MSARNMAKRTAAGTLALAVCLGGGAIALASAASADANFKFDQRIQRDDRYGTAIAASKAAFDKADNVILVNGYATVDGLTASYLAGVANAPILYVSDKGADDQTKAEIKRLGAKNIWLVGGEKVIPASVADAIKGDGYTVNRINGSDRYETAALIAEAGIKIAGKKPSTVFVASGTSFADALAVSPVAFVKGYPIILTDKDSTSDFSKKELGVIGTDSKVLVGGTAVVSDKVAADLSIKSDARVAGDDRAVTANKISDWAKKTQGFNPANAALVGGTNGNGADSLVAAPLLGKSFTTLHFAGWDATAVYMKDHASELTGKGFVFGGKAAVPDSQVSVAQSAAQSTAAVVNYTVTRGVDGAKMWYADAAQKKAVSITLTSDNLFFVDGKKATVGIFQAALSAGDLVSWSKDSAGVITYQLTSKTADDYKSGIVGSIDTGASTAAIVEPVTNVTLNAVAYGSATYRVFTIDGQAVSQSIFASSVSVGDTITVSGDGTTATNIQTVALKSGAVSGQVTGWTSGNTSVSLLLDTGATVSVPVPTSADTMTVDGKATTVVADVTTALSNGDAVTFSRSGGVSTFALKNSTPPQAAGQITAVTYQRDNVLSNFTYVDATSHTSVYVNNSAVKGTDTITTAGTGSVKQISTLSLSADPWVVGATKVYLTVPGVSSPVSVTLGADKSAAASALQTALNGSSVYTSGAVAVTASATAGNNVDYTITWQANGDNSSKLISNVESDKAAAIVLTVDGSLASGADIDSALTQGDTITYQAADSATKVKQSLDLKNTGYSGSIRPSLVTTSATKLGVFAAGSSTVSLGAAVDYSATSVLGLSGTPTYSVNGVSKTVGDFNKALDSIVAGGASGTVTLTQSGTKLVWALTVSVA